MPTFRLIARCTILMIVIAYMAYGVAAGLRTGVANAAGVRLARRKKPIAYWLVLTVQSILALAMAFAAYEIAFI